MVLRLLVGAVVVLILFNTDVHLRPLSQDITGGAARIFGRPDDPEVRREMVSPAGGSVTQRSNRPQQNNASDNQNSTDAVEDALELGNAARNSVPPRYREAEIAYRLAAKLSPKDPRPVIGLGNLWFDQKQYAAAATMYKQALTMLSAANGPSGGARRGPTDRRRRAAPVHAYLGVILIQAEDFANAQRELDDALLGDPENARWHALRGYSLAKQGKTVAARKAFEEALRLQPGNTDYQKLLESVPVQVP